MEKLVGIIIPIYNLYNNWSGNNFKYLLLKNI